MWAFPPPRERHSRSLKRCWQSQPAALSRCWRLPGTRVPTPGWSWSHRFSRWRSCCCCRRLFAGYADCPTEAVLQVRVRDWSLRDSLRGNIAELDVPLTIDRRPPRVSVATGLTYVRRGGAGVVQYQLSETTVRDGVQVGDAFFPGHDLGGSRVAFYAIPADAPDAPEPRVIAEDGAGNVARARWPVVVRERQMPVANVTLPASFLDTTVPDLAAAEGIDASDPTAAFATINTEVRAANEKRVREALADTAPEILWDGAFAQLANSKVTSRFAESRRTYLVGAASPSRRPPTSATTSHRPRAAPITCSGPPAEWPSPDELGIYGNCVVLDHGLGVASLYGHLSRLDVAAGRLASSSGPDSRPLGRHRSGRRRPSALRDPGGRRLRRPAGVVGSTSGYARTTWRGVPTSRRPPEPRGDRSRPRPRARVALARVATRGADHRTAAAPLQALPRRRRDRRRRATSRSTAPTPGACGAARGPGRGCAARPATTPEAQARATPSR